MSSRRHFEAGDRVLIVDSRGRRYLLTLQAGAQFHFHAGSIEHDALIGHPAGTEVRSTAGARLIAFRPTYNDYVLKMKRGAQVVYPKDASLIVTYVDAFPGARVLEAGTGSGALTIALARAVGESGLVVSYDAREDHHAQAEANIEGYFTAIGRKPDNVELRVGDITAGVPEDDFDRMVLDLPEPWAALATARGALLPGGSLCCYVPTVLQVSQTVEAMRRENFGMIETFEVLLRTWNVDGQSVRPDHRMVAHTGFIIVGRLKSG